MLSGNPQINQLIKCRGDQEEQGYYIARGHCSCPHRFVNPGYTYCLDFDVFHVQCLFVFFQYIKCKMLKKKMQTKNKC